MSKAKHNTRDTVAMCTMLYSLYWNGRDLRAYTAVVKRELSANEVNSKSSI